MDIKTIITAIDNGEFDESDLSCMRNHIHYAMRKNIDHIEDLHEEISYYGAAYSQSLEELAEYYHDEWELTDDDERESALYGAEYAINEHRSVVDIVIDAVTECKDAVERLADELP